MKKIEQVEKVVREKLPLKKARRTAGLTQAEVSNSANLSKVTVIAVERKEASMSSLFRYLEAIGYRIKVSPKQFGLTQPLILHDEWGKILKLLRRSSDLTLEEVAEKVGVTSRTIANMEGSRNGSIPTLLRLLETYNQKIELIKTQ